MKARQPIQLPINRPPMREHVKRHIWYATVSHLAENGEHRRFRRRFDQLGIAGNRGWRDLITWRGVVGFLALVVAFGIALEVCR